MSNIFKLSSSNRAARKQQFLNLETIRPNQESFGKKGLRALGPKIWNNLPPHFKSTENLSSLSGTVSLANESYAKSLRSEDLALWVFVFFIHTNTILRFVNCETIASRF